VRLSDGLIFLTRLLLLNMLDQLLLSFVLAAIGCAFAGLCYAEFANDTLLQVVRIPILMHIWENSWLSYWLGFSS
jgi:hypothetical protein